MPKVPVYDNYEELGPQPGVRQSSVVTPASLAAPFEQLDRAGRAVSGVGDALMKVATQMRREETEKAVLDLSNGLAEKVQMQHEAIAKREGDNAWGVTVDTTKWWDDLKTAYSKEITTPAVRDAFMKNFDRMRLQSRAFAGEYEAQQRKISLDNARGSAISLAQRNAIAAVGTVNERQAIFDARQQITENVLKRAKQKGHNNDAAEADLYKELSALHLGVIQRKVDAGDVKGAREYFTRYSKNTPGAELPTPLVEGNIDLANRPRRQNEDGSTSTVRSISVEIDGKQYLIPTIREDGRLMDDDEAVQEFRNSGKHLGAFKTVEEADAYAEAIHRAQEKMLAGEGDGRPRAYGGMPAEIDPKRWDDVERVLKKAETSEAAQREYQGALVVADGNLEEAMKNVRARKLDPDVEKEVLNRLKDAEAERKYFATEQQKKFDDAAWKAFQDNGHRIDKIPPSVWEGASGTTRKAIEDEADQRRRELAGGGGRKTDPGTYYELRKMMRDDPKKFRGEDLRKYSTRLSPSDFEEFVRLQTADEKEVKDVAAVDDQLRTAHNLLGLGNKDLEKKGAFDSVALAELDREQRQKGKPLTFEERQKVIDRLMMPGTIERGMWFDKSARWYEVQGTDEAAKFTPGSKKDREEAVAALRKQGFVAPTEKQITDLIKLHYGIQ